MKWAVLGQYLIWFLLATASVQANEIELAEDLHVRRLTDSVWLHISCVELEGHGRVPGNGLIIAGQGEADLAEWPNTIRALERKYPEAKIIVPGHGQPGGTELLRHTEELIESQASP